VTATEVQPWPPPTRTLFETRDVAAAEHALSRAYGALQIRAHGQDRGMRLAQARLSSSARFDYLSLSMTLDVTGTPPGALLIGRLRSGRVRHVSDGSERSYRPGDTFLAVQPGHPYTAQAELPDLEVAVLDPGLVRQVAGDAPGSPLPPVRFTGYEPASAQAAAQWESAFDYVRQLAHDPDTLTRPLVAGSASRLLAAAALTALLAGRQSLSGGPIRAVREDW